MLSFKNWLKEERGDKKQKIQNLIDGQNFILFFVKDKTVFAAPEEGRLVFAKLKIPDEEVTDGWADEASFAAFDLMKALAGQRVENLFSKKDINKIKVIDKDKAGEMMVDLPIKTQIAIKPNKNGIGIISLKDKIK